MIWGAGGLGDDLGEAASGAAASVCPRLEVSEVVDVLGPGA